jgi:hypothetical protein
MDLKFEAKKHVNERRQTLRRMMLVYLCSMWGSNPRPLAHKTNTLPTELMERLRSSRCNFSALSVLSYVPLQLRSRSDSSLHIFMKRVRGLVVMIVACQVMDPGSIPGERNFFCFHFLYTCFLFFCWKLHCHRCKEEIQWQ